MTGSKPVALPLGYVPIIKNSLIKKRLRGLKKEGGFLEALFAQVN